MKRAPVMLAVLATALALWLSSTVFSPTAHAGDNIWTWAGIGGDAWKVVSDPLNPDTVYALIGGKGIVKSVDGGSTWSDIAPSDWESPDIAVARGAPNVLYATANGSTYSPAVYLSTDGGATWELLENAPRGALAVSPVDWREAYLSGLDASFKPWVFKTVDGGNTWIDLTSRLSPTCQTNGALVISPSAPHILVARPIDKGCRSTDGGMTWSPMASPTTFATTVVFDPKNSDTMYMGANTPGGWKTSNGGSTWIPLANGLQPNAWEFIIDPDNTQVIYAANGPAGVVESLDGGASWTPINAGIQGLYVRSIAMASRNPLTLYAAVYGAGIYKMTRTSIQDFSITINSGALYTNQTAVTLSLTAPPGTTQMLLSNDGGFNGATWEAFADTKAWTIPAYGTYVIPRTVYAKFKTDGRVSGQYQDDIILDQTPPTGTIQIVDTVASTVVDPTSASTYSLARPSPATSTIIVYSPFVVRDYTPGLRSVGLSLSATDDVSGVDSMLISNNAGFAGAQWRAFVPKVDWRVKEGGTTVVYIKYRDRAKNESQVYSATTPAP